jgi:hypothetical protein
MNHAKRKPLYRRIEKDRKTKVLTFVTSDRVGMETRIAPDCVDLFVELLDKHGPTSRISLILHTNGGSTLAAWRLVNLIRTFCDELEVIIPLKALSAGTLISIGSDKIVMTKQAALGPIDPSVNNPLNPQANLGGAVRQVPVSVEAVRGYLNAAKDELNIKGEQGLTQVLVNLASYVHPLVLGEIFRSRAQIKFLADKLIQRQVKDSGKRSTIIDFLSADSGSHDYTINRREAAELGLNVEKPSDEFYKLLRKVQTSYSEELKLYQPYTPQGVLAGQPVNQPVQYTEVRGLVESAGGGCYAFVSEGVLRKVQVPGPHGVQEGLHDERSFEGWKKFT